MAAAPTLLAENAGLAFTGEAVWLQAQLTTDEVRKLSGASNACGRPNLDVLRRRIAVVEGGPAEAWQIDFPEHFTLQEASLYEKPFDRLQRRAPDWKNPHAKPDLRRALARVSRYLATPVHAAVPDWIWIEDDLIPDASLLVVARDDDFIHGILASDVFSAWHRLHCVEMPPDQLVASFPFPWPPNTGLSALSKTQEEARHAVARAVRSEDWDALHEAVCHVYGWPVDLSENELREKIAALRSGRALV